jgi:hypothetical protein
MCSCRPPDVLHCTWKSPQLLNIFMPRFDSTFDSRFTVQASEMLTRVYRMSSLTFEMYSLYDCCVFCFLCLHCLGVGLLVPRPRFAPTISIELDRQYSSLLPSFLPSAISLFVLDNILIGNLNDTLMFLHPHHHQLHRPLLHHCHHLLRNSCNAASVPGQSLPTAV